MADSYTFLRKLPLFADLPDAYLEQICQQVEELRLHTGDILFEEGSPGQRAYVIKEGQIEIYKTTNNHNVQLAVRQPGEVIGEMSLLESSTRNASGRALTDSLLLVLNRDTFDHMLDTNPSATRTMLHTVTSRMRSMELILNQSEKMAQLGTLTAGIAHELNNPSSAVKRGVEQFKSSFAQYQADTARLHALNLSEEQIQDIQSLAEQSLDWTASQISPIERSDRESEFEDWLEGQGIENSWELAPLLVNLGYSPEQMKPILAGFPPSALPAILAWIANHANLLGILNEISQGASRISEIVRAMKSYVYLDQAPVQSVSVHEGIDNTLVILRHKLKQGVTTQREYDSSLPPIQAYGSELNQVWTNIIDNAIDAMGGHGQLTIRTAFHDPWVLVDIADNGPGIPPEIQSRLFSPFFTTKPMGKGTGLGLSISYNIVHKHGGEIKVNSRPGETHFEVWLPQDFKQVRESGATFESVPRLADDELRRILEQAHTIAVVGIGQRADQPSHAIPAYLQNHGYRILPVNPHLENALGETAYADLPAVPEPVDIVLIFRASKYVPEVVDQAIQIGAKVVWMQEGIINEAAAQKARQAGLEVVMDSCIRKTHQRLFGEKSSVSKS